MRNRVVRAAQALGVRRPKNLRGKLAKILVVVTAIAGISFNAGLVNAATLTAASVALNDPRPSATANYSFTGSSVTNAAIRCVQLIWSTTSTGEVEPTAFDGTAGVVDAASSTLINSSATGWTLTRSDGSGATAGADNKWQYTRGTDLTPGTLTGATFNTTGLTSGSTANTGYYLKVNTYSDQTCTTARDNVTVQFIYTPGSTLSLTVDNSLTFTVNSVAGSTGCSGSTTTQASTATTIPFGNVVSGVYGLVCQDLTASTNATNGYTIYMRDTGEPVNALAQTISDVSPGTNSSPQAFSANNVEAYGYTTNDQTLSVTGDGADRFYDGGTYSWAANTTSNAEVAFEPTGVSSTTYRVGHQTAVALTTQPGTYSTTVIYTCTPVY